MLLARAAATSLLGLAFAHLAARPYRVAVLVVLSIAAAAVAVAPPIIVARVVDQAVEGRASAAGALAAMLGIAALALCETGLTLLRRRLTVDTEIVVRGENAAAHFRTMVRLPMSAYGPGNEAALIRSFDDLDTVVEFTVGHTVDLAAQALIVAGYIVLMLVVDWRMAAVFVGLAVIGLAHAAWHAREMQKAIGRWLPLRDRRFGFIVECITSMLTIKTLSAHADLSVPFRSEQEAEQAALRDFRNRRNAGDAVSRFWTIATPGIGTGFGVVLLTAGQLTAGGLVLFLSVSGALVGSLSVIHQNLQALHEAKAGFERMRRLTGMEPEPLLDRPRDLPPGLGALSAEEISFRHAAATHDVLHDVALEIAPGEHVAMVGPSGEGKTTLAHLLARLLTPTTGRIRHGERETDLDSYRRSVVLVPHTIAIFSASLRDNVRLWDDTVDDTAVDEALRLAALADLPAEHPAGLDMLLGANGNPLSAGQRQRLGLARVFLRRPDVLILDEATSALDGETERTVLTHIRERMQGRGLIVITHRETVAAMFARVVRVDDGRLVTIKDRDSEGVASIPVASRVS